MSRLGLHTALYKHLQDAVFVSTVDAVVPVFDSVPNGQKYPYITIGDQIGDDESYIADRLDRVTVFLHVWSDYRGQHEVLEILGQLVDLLDEQPLELDTGRLVSIRVTDTRSTRDSDEVTYMGRVTLRAYLQ